MEAKTSSEKTAKINISVEYLVLEIFYDLNLMGINGPPKMKIILAKDPFSLNNSNKNMKNIQNSEKIFVLKNKNPIYDECKIFLIIF